MGWHLFFSILKYEYGTSIIIYTCLIIQNMMSSAKLGPTGTQSCIQLTKLVYFNSNRFFCIAVGIRLGECQTVHCLECFTWLVIRSVCLCNVDI